VNRSDFIRAGTKGNPDYGRQRETHAKANLSVGPNASQAWADKIVKSWPMHTLHYCARVRVSVYVCVCVHVCVYVCRYAYIMNAMSYISLYARMYMRVCTRFHSNTWLYILLLETQCFSSQRMAGQIFSRCF
jgi:hypothetical protein